MNISEFTERFRSALTDKGVPGDIADGYILKLTADLSSEDTADTTPEQISALADSCAKTLLKKAKSDGKADASSWKIETIIDATDAEDVLADGIDDVEEIVADIADDGEWDDVAEISADVDEADDISAISALIGAERSTAAPERAGAPTPVAVPDEIGDKGGPERGGDDAGVNESSSASDMMGDFAPDMDAPSDPGLGQSFFSNPRGTAMFLLITALTSPLWLLAAAVFMLPFAVMFTAEAVITAGLICVLAGGAAAGAAASLTGIVYGIIKLFSEKPVGVYEIGFGIIIAGVTMIGGILIYNIAVRFMPWVFRRSGKLFRFVFGLVHPYLLKYKGWCEKL